MACGPPVEAPTTTSRRGGTLALVGGRCVEIPASGVATGDGGDILAAAAPAAAAENAPVVGRIDAGRDAGRSERTTPTFASSSLRTSTSSPGPVGRATKSNAPSSSALN